VSVEIRPHGMTHFEPAASIFRVALVTRIRVYNGCRQSKGRIPIRHQRGHKHMRPLSRLSIILFALVCTTFSWTQSPAFTPAIPDDVALRNVDIYSEGTRMAGDVYAPKAAAAKKLPTIVMAHGWGGTKAAFRPEAIAFAQAGYLVVAFDYRGWG